jgi:hypothetical protein
MDNRLSGVQSLAYQGVLAASPPNLTWQRRDPTTRDSANFVIGALWVTIPDKTLPATAVWMLIGLIQNNATWIKLWPEITPGAIVFPCDTGSATVIGGQTNVVGGDSIATSGSGNTITIDVDGNFVEIVVTNAGNATPAGGVLGILGGNNTSTRAAGINVFIDVIKDFVVPADGSMTFADPAFAEGVVQTDASGTMFADNGDDGQILIGGGTSLVPPAWAYITSASLDITSGPNTLNIELPPEVATEFETDDGTVDPD